VREPAKRSPRTIIGRSPSSSCPPQQAKGVGSDEERCDPWRLRHASRALPAASAPIRDRVKPLPAMAHRPLLEGTVRQYKGGASKSATAVGERATAAVGKDRATPERPSEARSNGPIGRCGGNGARDLRRRWCRTGRVERAVVTGRVERIVANGSWRMDRGERGCVGCHHRGSGGALLSPYAQHVRRRCLGAVRPVCTYPDLVSLAHSYSGDQFGYP
jgi:hypothetical protein